MPDEKEKMPVNLMALCAAFNFLQLFNDGSVALNVAHVESWEAHSDGRVTVTMQSGRTFTLFQEQAEELVSATRRALETASKNARDAGRIVVPGARGM